MRQIGDAIAAHGAHHQRPHEAQVHTPALLGQALAQTDEQERRADPDGAAQYGQAHARRGGHAATAGGRLPEGAEAAGTAFLRRAPVRAFNVSDSRMAMNRMPCRTFTVASGRSNPRCSRPPLALMPPMSRDTGITARWFWRAMNATSTPV